MHLNFVGLWVTNDVTGQVKVKISTFGTCSRVGDWRPLASSEWTEFWPNYSQLYTEGTFRVQLEPVP